MIKKKRDPIENFIVERNNQDGVVKGNIKIVTYTLLAAEAID